MRLFLVLPLLLLLAACNTGQTVSFDRLEPGRVRPGLTAVQAERIARVPNGLRKVWAMSGGAAFDAFRPVMDVRLRQSGGEVRWSGNVKFRLPGDNVREIARQIEAATGRSAPVQGDFALLPVAMASDLKGRITAFDFFGQRATYVPHDCQNVIGTCKSLWSDDNGNKRRVIVSTAENAGRWYATVRLDPAHNFGSARAIEQRVYSIDRYGLFIDASIINLEDDREPYFLRSLR